MRFIKIYVTKWGPINLECFVRTKTTLDEFPAFDCRSIVWKTRSTFCMLKHFFFTSTYVLQLKRKYLLNSFSLSLSLTKERRGDGNNKTHNIKLAVTLFKYNITRFALSLSLSLSCIKHTHSLSLFLSLSRDHDLAGCKKDKQWGL